jgi:hypothetical protein
MDDACIQKPYRMLAPTCIGVNLSAKSGGRWGVGAGFTDNI